MSLANDYMINEFKQFFQVNSSLSSSSKSSLPLSPLSSSSPTTTPTTFKDIINDIQRLAWVGTLCKEGNNHFNYL